MKPKIVATSLISVLCCAPLAWAATEAQENLMRSIDAIGNAPLMAQAEPVIADAPDVLASEMDSAMAEPGPSANEPAPADPSIPNIDDLLGEPAPAPEAPAPAEPSLPNIDDLLGEPAPTPETPEGTTPAVTDEIAKPVPAEPEVVVPDIADLLGEPAPAEPVTPDTESEPTALEPMEEVPPAEVPAEVPAETPSEPAMTDDAGGGEQLNEMEVVRRKAEEIEGLKKLQEANALLTRGEYDKAELLFEEVRLPERASTDAARSEATWGMAEAAYRRALELQSQISYERENLAASQKAVSDAEAKLSKALRDEAGHGEAARKLLRRVQAAGERLAVLSGRRRREHGDRGGAGPRLRP